MAQSNPRKEEVQFNVEGVKTVVIRPNGDRVEGPFMIKAVDGLGKISDVFVAFHPGHITAIRQLCQGKCILNLTETGEIELKDNKPVLSINMLYAQPA